MWVLSGLSAASSVKAGQEQAKQSRRAAEESKRVGKEQAKIAQEKGRRARGAQRAGFGAANVDLGYGTPQEVVLETLFTQIKEEESTLAMARAESSAYLQRARQAELGSYADAAGAFGTPIASEIKTG